MSGAGDEPRRGERANGFRPRMLFGPLAPQDPAVSLHRHPGFVRAFRPASPVGYDAAAPAGLKSEGVIDRPPSPSPLNYAPPPPRPKRTRWRGWVGAHVAASYLSLFAFVTAHAAVGSGSFSGGSFSVGGDVAGNVLLAVAACPLWVPVLLIVVPVGAAAQGAVPYPSFFVMAGTYAASLVLIGPAAERRDEADHRRGGSRW